jgi:predicted ATP-grasp superfamily ATP-dependent carboligase
MDLFADVDLQQCCSVTRLTGRYPEGFQHFIESELPGPWMYTGGLENRPRFIQLMARRRPLWGNEEPALSMCRNPEQVVSLLQSANLPAPAVVSPEKSSLTKRRWLLKPRNSAGGAGIRFRMPAEQVPRDRQTYQQEFIEGQSLAVLFLGDGRTARLLGITRQLVGETWLQAGPFRYCGSIGPLNPSIVRHPSLENLGHLLASACCLKGLFGIDGVCRDGTFWPVEINPRYTASVEVLEYATNWPILAWHGHVFLHNRLPSLPPPALPAGRMIGKAILFARQVLQFPADGPWLTEVRSPRPVEEMPRFADIPMAGETIVAGRPILTCFATADSLAVCEESLRQIAVDLDRRLFKG